MNTNSSVAGSAIAGRLPEKKLTMKESYASALSLMHPRVDLDGEFKSLAGDGKSPRQLSSGNLFVRSMQVLHPNVDVVAGVKIPKIDPMIFNIMEQNGRLAMEGITIQVCCMHTPEA